MRGFSISQFFYVGTNQPTTRVTLSTSLKCFQSCVLWPTNRVRRLYSYEYLPNFHHTFFFVKVLYLYILMFVITHILPLKKRSIFLLYYVESNISTGIPLKLVFLFQGMVV
jgi:type IV secretory pathway component VirB8